MDYVKQAVIRLIKKYKTNDPFELAEYLKIKIFYEPLGKNIRGFYQACPKNKIIHINNDLELHEKRIVCSHEMGHAVLHPKSNILFLEKHTFCVKNKFEREANKFAAELLINDELILTYENFTLEEIAGIKNIPVDLIKLKFNVDV